MPFVTGMNSLRVIRQCSHMQGNFCKGKYELYKLFLVCFVLNAQLINALY